MSLPALERIGHDVVPIGLVIVTTLVISRGPGGCSRCGTTCRR